MYKIIGANQTEYGPATVEQIRQWIGEGRINAQTSCQAIGETDWKPIASVPAFADLFAAAPTPSAPPLVSPPFVSPPPLGNNLPNLNGRAKALEEVNGPAIGLIVTAVLGILGTFFQMFASLFNAFDPFQSFGGMNMPQQNQAVFQMMHRFSGVTGTVGGIIGLAMGVFIIFAALKMKRLENHGMCLGASIVAIIPCVSPCCCIGIPIGIWALMVLNKPEIKSQFT